MAAPKIIVLGSLNGQLEPAFKKLTTLHSKNNFTMAILTGDVFAPTTDDAEAEAEADEAITALLDGSLQVPLPTYFTVATHALPPRIAAKVEADEEICENLHFLGKRSVTKTSDGIRIVALGGQLDAKLVAGQSKDQHFPLHTADDAKSLRGANSADVLLTSMWPAGVWTGSKAPLLPTQQDSVAASASVADLCAALKPRYHLSSSSGPFFYEREPFIHPMAKESDTPSVSRFISLAPYGNDAKAKAMYAFTLNKANDASVPEGATSSPFNPQAKKRPHAAADDSYSRFGNDHREDRHRGRKKHRHQAPPPGPDQCYFCLSNPNIGVHMCCSIGEDAYITTAKGPLPTATTFADQGVSFPAHFLIIPLPHNPTIASIGSVADADSEAAKAYREMTRFREAIQTTVASKSSRKLGAVTWEISRARNVHLHWQLVAVPAALINDGIAEAAFRVEGQDQKLPSFTAKDVPLEGLATAGDFFRVWLWADDGEDGVKGKSLVMPLDPDARFDLQFGRRVLAKLLGLQDRLRWQDCEQTVAEETADVEAFREAFKEWDFTLA